MNHLSIYPTHIVKLKTAKEYWYTTVLALDTDIRHCIKHAKAFTLLLLQISGLIWRILTHRMEGVTY